MDGSMNKPMKKKRKKKNSLGIFLFVHFVYTIIHVCKEYPV